MRSINKLVNIWLNCYISAKFISANNAKIKIAPTIPNLQYFTWTNTRKWVTNSQGEDMLAKFVNAYNHRQHTTLGMSPLQAMKYDQNQLYDTAIGKHLKRKQRKRLERDYSNIKVGDFVLVNKRGGPKMDP